MPSAIASLPIQSELRFKAKLRGLLERAGYRDGISNLDWRLVGNEVQGRFIAADGTRIFTFSVNSRGVQYAPASRFSRRDSYEVGRTLAFRNDKKNQCSSTTSYPCGNTCISDKKTCQISSAIVRSASLVLVGEAKRLKGESITEMELQRRVEAEEDKIRYLPYERGIVVDIKTGRTLVNVGGQQTRVDFTPEQSRLMKGNVLTHNHPNVYNANPSSPLYKGLSFSASDVQTACVYEVKELRAVSHGYRHSMKPPVNGWNERFWRTRVVPIHKRNYEAEYKRTMADLMTGRKTPDQAEVDFHHNVWTKTAKDTGMKYSRIEIRRVA